MLSLDALPERQGHVTSKAHFVPEQFQCERATLPGVISSRACVLYGARWVLAPVREVLHLIHGPVGCAYYSSQVRGKNYPVYSTALKEEDVVFGGQQKLRRAIGEALRLQPAARGVLVYTTCAAGLIGEDVETVCREASLQFGRPVVPVNCPGFGGKSQGTGHDVAARVLLEHFIARGPAGPVLENTLNILGEFDVQGDLQEIEQLLSELGLNVLCAVSGRAAVENLALARRAALNIVHCRRTGELLARLLEERYGISYLKGSFFGIAETAKTLKAVGRFFNREDACGHIEEKVAETWRRVAPYLPQLAGKRVAMFFGASRIGSMARAFQELGMEIVFAGAQCGSREDYREAGRCIAGGDTLLVDDASVQELGEFLRRCRPHLMVGGTREKFLAHKLGIPYLVFPQQNTPYAGFNGFVNLAREAAATINAPVWQMLRPARPPDLVILSARRWAGAGPGRRPSSSLSGREGPGAACIPPDPPFG
ncbi:MAG: nitrogenase [Armatimonadetes bacterium]|nr:nitrogenase [Armatimonadota bacterium]